MTLKTISVNRKAYHEYHVGETLEAGISLMGTEIKSIRAGQVNLRDAFVRPESGELWLMNAHIARYTAGGILGHEPTRSRRLLLHRKQINQLVGKMQEKGFTLVPVKLYLKGRLAKVEIALAKGKKLYDKREAISRRDTEREMDREIKRSNR